MVKINLGMEKILELIKYAIVSGRAESALCLIDDVLKDLARQREEEQSKGDEDSG